MNGVKHSTEVLLTIEGIKGQIDPLSTFLQDILQSFPAISSHALSNGLLNTYTYLKFLPTFVLENFFFKVYANFRNVLKKYHIYFQVIF